MTEGKPASAVTAQPAVFATTHWSVVLAAGEADTPQSSAALEKLCRTYWYPLYAHIRRRGYSEEEAKDLTQELFERLLERQFLCGLLREGGRFRSFLLTALDRFLVEHWQRSRAQKRGGGQPIVSIDAQTAEERYRLEPRDDAHHIRARSARIGGDSSSRARAAEAEVRRAPVARRRRAIVRRGKSRI